MLMIRTHLNVCTNKMLLGAEMLETMIQGFSHPTFYMLISDFGSCYLYLIWRSYKVILFWKIIEN